MNSDRWFYVMHYHEATYGPRGPQTQRDVKSTVWGRLTSWIIDRPGGWAVRIGHQTVLPFANNGGFIDLTQVGDADLLLHFQAISHADS